MRGNNGQAAPISKIPSRTGRDALKLISCDLIEADKVSGSAHSFCHRGFVLTGSADP